jgi:hypothetical protein
LETMIATGGDGISSRRHSAASPQALSYQPSALSCWPLAFGGWLPALAAPAPRRGERLRIVAAGKDFDV